jgi:hypothetical protein
VRVPRKRRKSAEVPRHTIDELENDGICGNPKWVKVTRNNLVKMKSREGPSPEDGRREIARKLGLGCSTVDAGSEWRWRSTAAARGQRRCTGVGCGGGDGERWHRLWGRFLQRRRSGGARAVEWERRCARAAATEKKRWRL